MVSRGDGCDVVASELVSLVDGVCVPLSPEHQVREHGDAERMPQVVGGEKNSSGVRTIQVGRSNSVQFCIHPVQLVQHQVYSQTIRPSH